MQSYDVFGGYLRSELPFPELPLADGDSPDWVLRVLDTLPPLGAESEIIGEEGSDRHVHVRLYKSAMGYRLWHRCTGHFDISLDGRCITWLPAPSCPEEMARWDILGRVLAVAMHARGTLSLHGSAVALGKRGIAFLAPKGSGKSTLALALASRGARLMTDDTVAIEIGPPAMVQPGVPALRLRSDSMRQLIRDPQVDCSPHDLKYVLRDLPEDRLARTPTALSAVYILTPVAGTDDSVPVRRTLLRTVPATMAVIRHAKIGALIGGLEARTLFDLAVAVARCVPVYSLEVLRDFRQLGRVVSALREWNEAPADAA